MRSELSRLLVLTDPRMVMEKFERIRLDFELPVHTLPENLKKEPGCNLAPHYTENQTFRTRHTLGLERKAVEDADSTLAAEAPGLQTG